MDIQSTNWDSDRWMPIRKISKKIQWKNYVWDLLYCVTFCSNLIYGLTSKYELYRSKSCWFVFRKTLLFVWFLRVIDYIKQNIVLFAKGRGDLYWLSSNVESISASKMWGRMRVPNAGTILDFSKSSDWGRLALDSKHGESGRDIK